MPDIIFNSFLKDTVDGAGIDLLNDTIKVALLTNSYTPDRDNHDFFDDVSGQEVVGTGYTAGGITLANKTLTQDNALDKAVFNADNVSWPNSTFTARYAVIYKSTGTASTSPLIGLLDFGADQTVNNTEFKITWGSAGIINVSQG